MTRTVRPPGGSAGAIGPPWRPTALAGILALTLAAYAGSLGNDFAWDDEYVLVGNQAVHTLADPVRFFTDPATGATSHGLLSYRPLRSLAFALVHHGFGLDPLPYHLLNVGLHLFNVVSVYWLMVGLGTARGTALLAAGLFGVHPIQTEAVGNVTGLTDVMFTTFYLAALLAFTSGLAGRIRFAAATACWLAFVAALASKEMALSLPLVAALIAWRAQRTATGRSTVFAWAVVGLLGLTAAGWIALRWSLLGSLGYDADQPGGTIARTALMQAEAVATYLRLLFLPLGLSVRHVIDVPLSALQARTLVSVAAVGAVLAWLAWALHRRREEALGLAWFCLTLLPVSNIVPLRGDIMGERFLYLPMIGLAVAVPAAARRWLAPADRAAIALSATLLVAFAAMTAIRNRDWKNNLTLFESAVRVAPTSNAVRLNLAREYARLGRQQDAQQQILAAADNTARYYGRYLALGDRARDRGDVEEAILWYERARRMRPGDPAVRQRLEGLGPTAPRRSPEAQPPPLP